MNFKRLTRGTATPRDLAVALDDLEIEDGEDFAIVKAGSLGEDTRGGARKTDPESSKESAEVTLTAPAKKAAFDAFVAAHPRSLAPFEVVERTGITDAWKRVSELKGDKLIQPSGKRWNEETRRNVDTYMLTVSGLLRAGIDTMRTRLEALPPEEVTAEPVLETESFLPSESKPQCAVNDDFD